MATQILNFQKLEVVGATKEEALAKAPFEAKYDATQAFKAWKKKQTGAVTEVAVRQFCLEYLEKKTKNIANAGCYVTLEGAVADTRERPYKYENVKREGTTDVRTTYVWIDDETDEVVGKVVGTKEKRATKADAAKLIKELMANGEYKGHASLFVRKEEEKPVALAHCAYTPSKASHVGVYMVFGIQA